MEYNKILLPSKTKKIEDNGIKGEFLIEGLFPGYGHTLGNVLRRTLLSSIPGSAVTKIVFDSHLHEFTTQEGVKDDMFTVVFNVKKLRAKLPKEGTIAKGVLKKDTLGIIKAGDIVFSDGTEVMNKDEYITEITTKNTTFGFEVHVERGYGFLEQKDINTKDKGSYKEVYPDAYFSPVHLVKYKVRDMRVGNRSDFNALEIQIETDGTVTPTESFSIGIDTLQTQLEAIHSFQENIVEKKTGSKKTKGVRIGDLELGDHICKLLIESNIETLEDLEQMTEAEIQDIPGIGEKALEEIKKAVADYGIILT